MAFFDPQKGIWPFFGKVADLLGLSLLWIVCSLPVVTMGAATAALYDSVSHCLRKGENGPMARFLSSFKKELMTATIAHLLWGAVIAALVAVVWYLRGQMAVFEGLPAAALEAVWFLVLLIPVGCWCWMFPLLSRFTFSSTHLISTGLRFTFAYLPRTLAVVIVFMAGLTFTLWLFLPILIVPALVVLVWTYLMEPAFQKYM